MSRSVTRRTQDNRQALRSELLEQLLDVLERMLDTGADYMSITVDSLVSEAGVSKSKFYVYFKDKEDLLNSGFTRIVEELETISDLWWELGPQTTRESLRAVLRVILSTYRPRIPLLTAAYDSTHFDEAVAAKVAELTDSVIDSLRDLIERGQREGWTDPGILAPETAAWIVWMAERGQSKMVRGADDAEFERLADSCSGLIWNALYARAPIRTGAAGQ
jgi:AcrR family transcriptional regulator